VSDAFTNFVDRVEWMYSRSNFEVALSF